MSSLQDWVTLREIGEGGQGKVYEVCRKADFDTSLLIPELRRALSGLTTAQTPQTTPGYFQQFRDVIKKMLRIEDPLTHGALKVLHQPKDARNADKALDCIKNEIEAMKENTHPNLLPLLDSDTEAKWYVSPFYGKGTLSGNLKRFTGNPFMALKALRPLVEGVATLHDKGRVHRDIKPQNIFLDAEDNLILGDFGLVFFTDQQRIRLSDTFENVGSRDWMPGWALSMRLEDIKPSFDVFSLGKVLWSMVSGKLPAPLVFQ